MTDDPESFGGYYPFECIGRMEHLGIFCITVDRAAYVISKHGDVEEFGDLEIPAHDSYLQWLEILTKGINRKTLKTAIASSIMKCKTGFEEYLIRGFESQPFPGPVI